MSNSYFSLFTFHFSLHSLLKGVVAVLLLFLPPLLGEGSGVRLLAEGGKSQVRLADPYILLEGDTYYAYGTYDSDGIHCYSSDDLRTWKDEGQALNKQNATETRWFWAPEVYNIGGKYIMYFSANEHLFAATATSPKGPFKQVGSYQMESLIGDEKCIDSHVYIDEDSTAYIFFVRFTDGNCIWQAQLSDDFITPVAGTLRKCFAASQSWELKMGRVNEGPNVLRNGRRYYLTYSGNDYQSQDYAVGFATTTNIAKGTWSKFGSNPILHRWDDLVGTGHHSFFYDKEGLLRIVFHAHDSEESIHPRRMYIGTAQFRGTSLVMLSDPIIRPTLSASAPYNPELITQSWGFERGGAATVDLNNDGSQDIVAAGSGNTVQNSATDEQTSKRMSWLATFSSTTHKWTKVTQTPPFKVADSPSLVPCDINNDGNMDIIAFEQTGWDTSEEAYTGGYSHEGIFLGRGNGTFGEAVVQTPSNSPVKGEDLAANAPLTLRESWGGSFPLGQDLEGAGSAEIIDIDNDGRLDIILVGHQDGANCNVILHNQTTEGNALTFSVEPFEPDFLLRDAIIQTADFNNDGLQDFVVSALVDGMDGQLRFPDVYLNDPDRRGQFTRLGLGEKGADLKRKSSGALQVADFNDDGWADILLAGLGETSSGEAATRQRIYLNQQTAVPSFKAATGDFQLDSYVLSSAAGNSAGVIDWNGDGYYDVMLGGTKSNVYGGMLYLNDGRGRLRRSTAIPGATGACIIFPDYNGDGRKDFLLNGLSKDNNYLTAEQQGRNAILCSNLYPTPSRPDAPVAPAFEKQDGGVTLSWQAPETAHPGFTYEVYIMDEAGNLVNSTPSHIGGTRDGIRTVNRPGRAGHLTQWTFFPTKPGTYSWGVQTIDAAYTGSLFTEGPQFTVTEEDISDGIAEVKSEKLKAKNEGDALYDLSGRQLLKPRKGINIILDKQKARKALQRN